MAIDRNSTLNVGEILIGIHKKDVSRLRVDGAKAFTLIESKLPLPEKPFTSLSNAQDYVTSGRRNGWAFWTREAEYEAEAAASIDPVDRLAAEPDAITRMAKKVAVAVADAAANRPARKAIEAAPKMVKVIKRVANQKGVAEGSTKWFCSCCQKGFVAEGKDRPDACPEGHAAEQRDDLAPTA